MNRSKIVNKVAWCAPTTLPTMSGRGRGRGRGRSFGRGGRFFPNQSFVRKNNEAPITSSSNKWVRPVTGKTAATTTDQ